MLVVSRRRVFSEQVFLRVVHHEIKNCLLSSPVHVGRGHEVKTNAFAKARDHTGSLDINHCFASYRDTGWTICTTARTSNGMAVNLRSTLLVSIVMQVLELEKSARRR